MKLGTAAMLGQEAGRIFVMDIQRHALLEPFV
jgi:hypothetical protein